MARRAAILRSTLRNARPGSSAGQSSGFLIRRSQVRVLPGVPRPSREAHAATSRARVGVKKLRPHERGAPQGRRAGKHGALAEQGPRGAATPQVRVLPGVPRPSREAHAATSRARVGVKKLRPHERGAPQGRRAGKHGALAEQGPRGAATPQVRVLPGVPRPSREAHAATSRARVGVKKLRPHERGAPQGRRAGKHGALAEQGPTGAATPQVRVLPGVPRPSREAHAATSRARVGVKKLRPHERGAPQGRRAGKHGALAEQGPTGAATPQVRVLPGVPALDDPRVRVLPGVPRKT